MNESNVGTLYEGMSIIIRSRVSEDIWAGTLGTIDWSNPVSASSSDYYSDVSETEMNGSSKYAFYVELDSMDGLMLGQHVYIEPDYGQEEDSGEVISLGSWYLNDLDGKPWVWAESSKGTLEKREVTLGDYDEELDSYVIEDGLELTDYIAFPDESYKAGMTCEEYDEAAFAVDEDGYYEEGDYTENGMYEEGVYEEGVYEEGVYEEEGVYDEDSGYSEDDAYVEDGVDAGFAAEANEE